MGDLPEHADAAEEQPKSKLPLIVGGLLVFLIIAGAISFMVLGGGGDEPALRAPTPEPPGAMVEFDQPFTTNLAPPDDQYMFSATITLEMKPAGGASEEEMLDEIGMGPSGEEAKNNYRAKVFQTIYEAIQTKSRNQMTSEAGRENLRTEIKRELNAFLQKGEVADVYIYAVTIN